MNDMNPNPTPDMNPNPTPEMNPNPMPEMNPNPMNNQTGAPAKDDKNVVRFLLTFFLGWIGSLIINCSSLKPVGYKSRTGAYFGLSLLTFGIYGLVASFSNLGFDPAKEKNIGYKKEM